MHSLVVAYKLVGVPSWCSSISQCHCNCYQSFVWLPLRLPDRQCSYFEILYFYKKRFLVFRGESRLILKSVYWFWFHLFLVPRLSRKNQPTKKSQTSSLSHGLLGLLLETPGLGDYKTPKTLSSKRKVDFCLLMVFFLNNLHSVHSPHSFCWGVKPPRKGRGLTVPQFLEGICWERWGWLFQGGCNFPTKTILKSGIFNDK